VTIADDYINKVLNLMPAGMPSRAQIATELRGHIAERLADGHPLDAVLRQLGDPVQLAESYLSAEPLASASFLTRAAAKFTDVACVLACVIPIAWLIALAFPPGPRFVIMVFACAVGGSLAFCIYTIMMESRTGQTVGKRLQGIRVISETGARITLGQAFVRALPMLMQVFWIDAMFALFTEKSQRAFELLSKTRVVRA
jgi:uncharacterized RDD family membrane protein YckC